MRMRCWWPLMVCGACLMGGEAQVAHAAKKTPGQAAPEAVDVAAQVDRLIEQELTQAGATIAGPAGPEDFLRRISLDITGTLPAPEQVTLFGLDPNPDKRARMIEKLLASPAYGKNWASYWRDVIFLSATNMRGRGAAATFESWMVDQLNQNRPWDAIVTDLLTATGNVNENGATALLFAHSAEPEEVAAEACRIFLGIQIQCANCHDHPSDIWKREQFHELAAYFPRTAVRPILVDGMQRGFEVVSVNQARRAPGEMLKENPERLFMVADRNRDRKITKDEVQNVPQLNMVARIFDRVLEGGDTNKDNAISLEEIRKLELPGMPGQRATEYYMPDLKDPSSQGNLIQPKFFVDNSRPGKGLSDEDRRKAAAKAFTDVDNPWFARAVINRVWHELLGEGFYMPVDDLGPTRTPTYPQVLDTLADGFIAHRYDLKWLVRTVTNTQAYQRQVRPRSASPESLPFAAQTPTRLRSDQLFNALSSVLGFREPEPPAAMGGPMAMFAALRSPRNQFNQLFTFDPSTPQEDLTGNVQQALFLMNTPLFRNAASATGNSRLGQLLRKYSDDQDALAELYLLVLAREPSDQELKVCQTHLQEVGNRGEAYEDLLWTLINGSEFLSRR